MTNTTQAIANRYPENGEPDCTGVPGTLTLQKQISQLRSEQQRVAEVIRAAFFTSVSGDGPHRYYLSLAYPTMEAMHDAEDAIKAWAKSVLEPGEKTDAE